MITDPSTLTFTGASFFILGEIATVTFGGILADSVTVDSETGLTAVYDLGVPIVDIEEIPLLTFESDEAVYYAISDFNLSNPLVVAADSSIASCSFGGGCVLEVTSNGLATHLKNEDAHIEVCGDICEFQESDSSSSVSKCSVPPLSTEYSNENFKIATETEDLKAGSYFGSNGNFARVFDNNNLNHASDGNQNCWVGMDFGADHVGMISQVKYFMQNFDKSKMVGVLRFQGSTDGELYSTLFVADDNIHEGWNYFSWDSEVYLPAYRFFRFKGTYVGSCKINEVKVIGVKTIKNSDPTF